MCSIFWKFNNINEYLFFRNGASSLHTQGSLQYKVAVSAKDDVYDKTRESMKLVEEETKKLWYVIFFTFLQSYYSTNAIMF